MDVLELTPEAYEDLLKVADVTNGDKPKLHLITFKELLCKRTEDSGWDETYLNIYIDDLLAGLDEAVLSTLRSVTSLLPDAVGFVLDLPTALTPIRKGWTGEGSPTMTENSTLQIQMTLPLLPGRAIRLRLWDEDGDFPGDDADFLGEHAITIHPDDRNGVDESKFPNGPRVAQDPNGWYAVVFTEDDADYALGYKIRSFELAKLPVAPPSGEGEGEGGTFKLPGPVEDAAPSGGGDILASGSFGRLVQHSPRAEALRQTDGAPDLSEVLEKAKMTPALVVHRPSR